MPKLIGFRSPSTTMESVRQPPHRSRLGHGVGAGLLDEVARADQGQEATVKKRP
jgi:hypothetical protein